MVYAGICDRMSQIFAGSVVTGSSYCNRKVDSETETDRDQIIFIW